MECQTIIGYKVGGRTHGQPIYHHKKAYDTLENAIETAKLINSQELAVSKLVAYKCKTCYKYHLGRNGSILKEKEKNKWKSINAVMIPNTFEDNLKKLIQNKDYESAANLFRK